MNFNFNFVFNYLLWNVEWKCKVDLNIKVKLSHIDKFPVFNFRNTHRLVIVCFYLTLICKVQNKISILIKQSDILATIKYIIKLVHSFREIKPIHIIAKNRNILKNWILILILSLLIWKFFQRPNSNQITISIKAVNNSRIKETMKFSQPWLNWVLWLINWWCLL